MIAPQVFQHADEYARRFASAQPFRHVSIDGFFDRGACERLLAHFPAFSDRHAVNEMGLIGNKAVRTDVGNLDAVFSELDAQVRSPEFLALVSRVTGMPALHAIRSVVAAPPGIMTSTDLPLRAFAGRFATPKSYRMS